MFADILKALGTLIVAAGLVWLALAWLRRQAARDQLADRQRRGRAPYEQPGGATDGSDDDDGPTQVNAS